ncbi:MAG: isochorismate synthase [Aggregatilineales bacterium]
MTDITQTSEYKTIPEQLGRLVSVSMPCPEITLAGFLRHARQENQPRFYWESNRDHVAFAGFGTAVEIMEWGEERFQDIERRARELFDTSVVLDENEPLAAPRLFGGFAFRDDFVPDAAWADFTPAHFVLPHYQLVSINGDKWLTINAHIPIDDSPDDYLAELREALVERIELLRETEQTRFDPAQQTASEVNYPMPFETWSTNISAATTRMKNGELNKVVLSRVAEVRFAYPVDIDGALGYLADHYAECYRFLFEPRPGRAFYGATPELLAGVHGRIVSSMALAGSIKRGKTPDEDFDYAKTLLNDPKERYEHQLVVDAGKDRIGAITETLTVGETGLYKLSNIQHLYTPIEGRLKTDSGIVPVVAALHPTPALGGDPRDIAMQLIGEYEPVPRGWYAAPVGWIDRHMNGQFAVAIRSAVAQNQRVWMYAGAGIVKDSIPQNEWDETALKFRPMMEALGIK